MPEIAHITKFTLTPVATGKNSPQIYVRVFLVFLTMVAGYIRVHNAGMFYYNADEAMVSTIAAGRTIGEVLSHSRYEIHPPLFYVVAHYWEMISAAPPFMRFLPLIFGLTAIPVYYAIGRLLAGELAGLCCASIIAFSPGCIIQSYVVRHYMLFVLCISSAFYCYLRWREKPTKIMLAGYGAFAMMGCLSHFSGIFDVICIGGFETLYLMRYQQPRSVFTAWISVNCAVTAGALYVYSLWQPIMKPLHSYFAVYTSLSSTIMAALHDYPLAVGRYVFPGQSNAVTMIIFALLAFFGLRVEAALRPAARVKPLILLAMISLLFGIMLMLTGIYPQPGTRRSLWLLPMLVAPAGWVVAIALQCMVQKALPSMKPFHMPVYALILCSAGLLLYHEQARYDDGSEYTWQQTVWNDFQKYMHTLGPHEIIVTEKDDGIMLTDLYKYMGSDALTGKSMATLAPYGPTHILFNPYYPRNYSTPVLLSTLKEAGNRHLLDSADKLVFLRMAWSRSPLTDLMLCGALDKQVITFPGFISTAAREDIERARAAVMIVSRQTLLHDILPENGKARACLDHKHDMVPGFIP